MPTMLRKRPYSTKKYRKRPISVPHPRPELHRLQWTPAQLNMASIPTTWREVDLCGSLVTGAIFYNRLGSKVSIRSVRWRGVMAGGATGSSGVDDFYNTIRLVVYTHASPKTGTGLTPLATAGVNGSGAIHPDYVPGLQRVLFDKMIGLTNNPWGNGNSAPATREFDFFHVFPGRGLEIQYNNTTSDQDNLGLYVAAISDSGTVPNCGMVMGNAELTWYDV